VEEGYDGSLELGSASGVNGRGRKGLPDNSLADVGGDEEGNSRSQSVTLLKELIKLK